MMKLDYQSDLDRFRTEEDGELEENLGGFSSSEEEKKTLVSKKVRMKMKGSPKTKGGGDWVCRLCSKEFRSSKALGGHMRVHMEEQRASKGAVSAAGSGDGPPTCSLCNKTFPSRKSLFGHMRCHPERQWRGMQPPLKASSNSTDPPVRVGGWSRRGRSTDHQSSLKHDDEDEQRLFNDAVYGLMLLATGKDSYRIHPKNADVDEYEMGVKLSDDHNPIYISSINLHSKRKRKRKSDSASRSYSCSICNKSFPTPQALGGHTSSAHNKLLIRNMGPELLDFGVSTTRPVDIPAPDVVLAAHICRICEKSFPTGQALGGHKRCHYWLGPADQAVACLPPAAEIMCSPATSTRRDFSGFDLNETPADDFEVSGSIL